MLPSISIDNGVLLALQFGSICSVLDQLNGIEYYLGTAVGLHLQKFWINFAESNVMMTLERHFGWPDGVKLALEPRLEQPGGAKLALERRFGSPSGVMLALERRFGSRNGVGDTLERF